MKDVINKLGLPEVAEMMESRRDTLTARGYTVDVAAYGVQTVSGHRGVILRAVGPKGTYSLSIEIDVDALKHVIALVDGKLFAGETAFPLSANPYDLVDKMRAKIAWFVDAHVPT